LGFVLDGWLYGYLYYEPTNPQPRYDIAFALYEPGDGWFLAGFYINAEFVADGAPTNKNILAQKAHDLRLLEDAHSLGREYAGMSDAERITKLRKAAIDYKWRVRPKNAIGLKTPIRIPDTIFVPRTYRYRRPAIITASVFHAIRQLTYSLRTDEQPPLNDLDYFEGDSFEIGHKKKERNRELVKAAKARFIRKHGRLFCEVCSFDFEREYDARGRNFIEAHHIAPVSKMQGRTAVKVDELAMVCANCHRMIHRKEPALTLERLKEIYVNRSSVNGALSKRRG
jgi:5-methylcytosine-specific restriction protein A